MGIPPVLQESVRQAVLDRQWGWGALERQRNQTRDSLTTIPPGEEIRPPTPDPTPDVGEELRLPTPESIPGMGGETRLPVTDATPAPATIGQSITDGSGLGDNLADTALLMIAAEEDTMDEAAAPAGDRPAIPRAFIVARNREYRVRGRVAVTCGVRLAQVPADGLEERDRANHDRANFERRQCDNRGASQMHLRRHSRDRRRLIDRVFTLGVEAT